MMTRYWVLLLIVGCMAIDNGLGKTPAMGWNPWNKYFCGINEQIIRSTADALVSSGLAAAGYIYLNLDDCWQSSRDSLTGRIIADPIKFPSGIAALSKYVHSKGLKFGLYSDAGFQTCAGKPGSLGFEEIDAATYAEWDVDYLKYDNCFTDGTSPKKRYPVMSEALLKQTKKIYFSICEWGVEDPHLWAPALGNSWRTTGDIGDNWVSFTHILDLQVGLESYAGPGGWNDPDMLEVGNGGMSTKEYESHFALWALLKSPLLIGCDITNMSADTKRILMNKEIIAINQDSLGQQGKRISKSGDLEIWAVKVADNGAGVVAILFNRSKSAQQMTVKFSDLGIGASQKLREINKLIELGVFTDSYSTNVESHHVAVIKFTPALQYE